MQFNELGKKWEYLAETDPLWAILSDENKKGNRWNLDEFFEVGQWNAREFVQLSKQLISNLHFDKGLDFGCGVGRLTIGHAHFFDKMVGVDISKEMIELANKYNKFPERVSYLLNKKDNLELFYDNEFDYIIAHIVLQHMPPEFHLRYIKEFIRVLKPEGLCIFQLPEPFDEGWGSQAFDESTRDKLDMFGSPREEVQSLLLENGARILRIEEDGACGPSHTSYRYCFTKV